MDITIELKESSQPIQYLGVENAYSKGDLYCILFKQQGEPKVHKFPVSSIFRVIEDFGQRSGRVTPTDS